LNSIYFTVFISKEMNHYRVVLAFGCKNANLLFFKLIANIN